MSERPPNWRCIGEQTLMSDPDTGHWLTGYAKKYGSEESPRCQRCCVAVTRRLAEAGKLVDAMFVRGVLDALDAERKNLQDEMREVGRELQDAAAETEYWRSQADREAGW